MFKLFQLLVLALVLSALVFSESAFSLEEKYEETNKTIKDSKTNLSEKDKVKGTLVCLLPDFNSAGIKPVVPKGQCDGQGPHEHAIVTHNGEVMAIEGSEQQIEQLEKMIGDRTKTTLKGKIKGSKKALILELE